MVVLPIDLSATFFLLKALFAYPSSADLSNVLFVVVVDDDHACMQ